MNGSGKCEESVREAINDEEPVVRDNRDDEIKSVIDQKEGTRVNETSNHVTGSKEGIVV